jgi:hypothetical protein
MAAPAIGVRQRWAPGPNTAIDWSHPLSQRLVMAVGGESLPLVDKVSGRTFTNRGAPTTGARTVYGTGIDMASSSNKGGFLDVSASGDPLRLAVPLTIAWVGHQVSSPAAGGVWAGMSFTTTDSAPFYNAIVVANGATFAVQFGFNDGGNFTSANGTTVMTSYSGPLVIVCTLTSSASEVWVNGAREGTGAGSAGFTYGSPEFQIGTWIAATSRGCGGNMAGAFTWARALSANEVEAFTADPFQMFRR